jgi:hypothetical protein
LQQAPDRELVTPAAVLAKGLVSVIDGDGLQAQRASALNLLDSAGRAIRKGAAQAPIAGRC